MIYLISPKNLPVLHSSLGSDKRIPWVKLLKQLPPDYKPKRGDQVYYDIFGLDPAEQKKISGVLKKSGAFWGIIDPKGTAVDPASFFFKGAADYIGPNLIKKGLNKRRFTEAFQRTRRRAGDASTAYYANTEYNRAGIKRTKYKLPAGKFPGWKSLRSGTSETFFFLFVSLSGSLNLRTILGEAAFTVLKNRLREVLQQSFRESDALLWMETEGNNLLLIPPKLSNARIAVETAYKMILNSKLIGIEKFGLSIPVDFTFALHYGQTIFQAPGKTGAVISESVNYIFHLGTKKAETGRLTISGDVPDGIISEGISDLVVPAGVFEGIPILHTERFL